VKEQQVLAECKRADSGARSTVWVVAEDTGAMGCSKGRTEGRGEAGGMRKLCDEWKGE